MYYLVFYLMCLTLLIIIWFTYIPKQSFVHYIRNIEPNFSKDWKLYKINNYNTEFNYFILINKKIDEVILFEYDYYYKEFYTKDSRIRTYQEQKILTNIIKKEYNESKLNNAEKIEQEQFNELKNNYKKSYYFISGYDYQLPLEIKI